MGEEVLSQPETFLRGKRSWRPWNITISPILATILIVGAVVGTMAMLPQSSCACISKKAMCGIHLKSVTTALAAYAGKHDGQLPDSLAQLANGPDSTVNSGFIVRSSSKKPYIYLGAGKNLNDLDPNTILLYEAPDSHQEGVFGAHAMYVTRAAGTVEFLNGKITDKIASELTAGHNPPRAEKLH